MTPRTIGGHGSGAAIPRAHHVHGARVEELIFRSLRCRGRRAAIGRARRPFGCRRIGPATLTAGLAIGRARGAFRCRRIRSAAIGSAPFAVGQASAALRWRVVGPARAMRAEYRPATATLRRGIVSPASAVPLTPAPVSRWLRGRRSHLATKFWRGALRPIASRVLGTSLLRARILGPRILRASVLARGLATLFLSIACGLATSFAVGPLFPALGLSFRSRSLGGGGRTLLRTIAFRAERIATIAPPMPATTTVLFGSPFGSFRLFRIVR